SSSSSRDTMSLCKNLLTESHFGSSEESRRKKQKHSKEKKTDTRKSLTSAQKAEICYLKLKGISQVKLAKQFGVAKATISAKKFPLLEEALALWISRANRMIHNCWRKTGILLEDFLSKLFLYEELNQANEPDITDDIQELIMQLPLDQLMDTQEYVIADNNLITTEMPTDEEIIEAVKNCDCIEPEEESQCKLISLAEDLEKLKKK
ncbi:12338_t:CDS:2, partial [Dentiscutata heterogama]